MAAAFLESIHSYVLLQTVRWMPCETVDSISIDLDPTAVGFLSLLSPPIHLVSVKTGQLKVVSMGFRCNVGCDGSTSLLSPHNQLFFTTPSSSLAITIPFHQCLNNLNEVINETKGHKKQGVIIINGYHHFIAGKRPFLTLSISV